MSELHALSCNDRVLYSLGLNNCF